MTLKPISILCFLLPISQNLHSQIQFAIAPDTDSTLALSYDVTLRYELKNNYWHGVNMYPPEVGKTVELYFRACGESHWHLVQNQISSDPIFLRKYRAKKRSHGALAFYYDFDLSQTSCYEIYGLYYPDGIPEIIEQRKGRNFIFSYLEKTPSNILQIWTETFEGIDADAWIYMTNHNLIEYFLQFGTYSNHDAKTHKVEIELFLQEFSQSKFYTVFETIYRFIR